MEESDHYHHRRHQPSRLGLRNTGGGGEIVEIEGGHIVRSTGRKDRHSKVRTAKGPRDRRVRLSAHTAIQFYDVQDRLGYDRPSKAVDWLIKNAKASIDELAELPAWKPTAGSATIDQNPSSSGSKFDPNIPQSELISRTSSQNQDLKLSLQSIQDPIAHLETEQGNNIGFGGSSWPEDGGFSGFVVNSPATQTTPLFGQTTNNQLLNYISQRGPLQSSNTPPVRPWQPFSGVAVDQHPTLAFHHSCSMPGFSGFSGLQIPARVHGDEEEHDGIFDKPSSASSDPRH